MVGVKALTTIYDVSMLVKAVESLDVQLVIPLCQLVKKQGDRDENIKALAASMRDMLASLSEIQELEKIKLLQTAIDGATSRMNECAEFVIVYARHGFWGEFV
jgi:sulfopyruvate decarboxylase TPP-binding subunit